MNQIQFTLYDDVAAYHVLLKKNRKEKNNRWEGNLAMWRFIEMENKCFDKNISCGSKRRGKQY